MFLFSTFIFLGTQRYSQRIIAGFLVKFLRQVLVSEESIWSLGSASYISVSGLLKSTWKSYHLIHAQNQKHQQELPNLLNSAEFCLVSLWEEKNVSSTEEVKVLGSASCRWRNLVQPQDLHRCEVLD